MASENEEVTNDGPLTLSEAVKAFSAPATEPVSEEEEPGDDDGQEGDIADDELPLEDGGEDEGDDIDDEEQAEPDEDDGEGEDGDEQLDAGQGRFVADTARVKLPDGTFTTVAELKAGSLRRDDYTRKTQETAAEKQAASGEREQLTQLRQANEDIRAYTISVLEQFMPQMPDDALYATDIVKAMEQERQYKARKEQLDYLKAQRDWDKEQSTQQQSKEARERANAEWAHLVAHPEMSDLKDETRGKALLGKLMTYGQRQGFSDQELRSAFSFDHRQGVILKKAMAFDEMQDKLKASKAKVPAKIEGRPPVQKSSKRLNSSGLAHREVKVAMKSLDQSGSLKDGVRAYLASQKTAKG